MDVRNVINLKPALVVIIALAAAACGPFNSGPAAKASPSANAYQQALAFARCMRSHGVPDFPDPQSGSGGGFTISNDSPGGDLDPSSTAYQSAMTACQSLLPNDKGGSRGMTAADKQKLLAFSACMRSHGVPDFPDPTFNSNGAGVSITGGQSSDLNPNSAAFQSAQKACQSLLPGGGRGMATNSSGGGRQTTTAGDGSGQ